jgi:hypothetical protein
MINAMISVLMFKYEKDMAYKVEDNNFKLKRQS